ncbi:hypothetical protein AMK26_14045 [Streptomyces sp. CB03234]|uniref:nitroreductase/quinone reductase family protein n=1 Tax=Streptomyces sp. (strain CB03234) TaxID=1703937 RepID=UPI00093C1965|nr:nitroreductase/quinone reductase family protein [Streptomyces sp. CB03234]OKK04469.1 hypothetical protein AMK26_14045 [Streptomyces sp. CB03234]
MTPPRTEPHRSKPLAGWRNRLHRAPLHLYRIGLGSLFGRHLLLMYAHRTSGVTRKAVLEVVAHDPQVPAWTMASRVDPTAEWYRDLRMTPKVTIQFGSRYHAVTAHFVPTAEGDRIMARYAMARPRLTKRLCVFMGLLDDSMEEMRGTDASVLFVRLCGPGREGH